MGWPDKTEMLGEVLPTTICHGPDIIFLWVARMIMAGYEYLDEKPFGNVYFTGIIRTRRPQDVEVVRKLTRPLDLIAKYGADGCVSSHAHRAQGQDISWFNEKRCEVAETS